MRVYANKQTTASNNQSTIACALALMEDDETFKVELVDVFMKTRTDEYKKICPLGISPCLVLSDKGDDPEKTTTTSIWESNTIMRYFCDVTAESSPLSRQLYPPDDLVRRAKINMVLDWRQCDFYPKLPDIAYIMFGMPNDDDKAKSSFKDLQEKVFPILTDEFLDGGSNLFIYGNDVTIADLSVALPLAYIKARPKFWDAVPQSIKDYHERVKSKFPQANQSFDSLKAIYENFSGDGRDLEP